MTLCFRMSGVDVDLAFKNTEKINALYRKFREDGKIKNLLAAGRCISGSHEAQASFRIMPTCCSTGEAAGVAVAVAAQEHTDFPETDVKKIQALLRKHHAFIGE